VIVERDLPTLDAKAFAFLESVRALTSLHGFDSGMLPWLSRFRPMLYAELTGWLVDRIQQSWERNDLGAFADALDDFEKAFSDAVELYRHRKELENG
jgi:hypothetical protein